MKGAQIRHEFVEVNGVRLHYATAGRGELILFAHGFPEFWYAWKGQLPEFSGDHQAIALDMRGYNLSSKPKEVEQYAMPLLVEDVRQFAAKLGHEKFTLVGHDWGGVVAWAFAIAHPECLERLIVINAPHPAVFARELRHNPRQKKASSYMLAFRIPLAEKFLAANGYAALFRTVMGEAKTGAFTEEDRAAYIEAWSQPGALAGGLNYYRAAQRGSSLFAVNDGEAVVRVPTLVIWGEADRYLLPGNLEGLGEYVPDLTVRRVPDASHWIVHEQPALVNAWIREFIEQE